MSAAFEELLNEFAAAAFDANTNDCWNGTGKKLDDARAAVLAHVAAVGAALEEARNGLLWYHDTYPDSVNDCDAEAMERIDAALARVPK